MSFTVCAIHSDVLSEQLPCCMRFCHVCYAQISQLNPHVYPPVSDGCSSCNRRLRIPHTINIQNIQTIRNMGRGMIASLRLCIAFRLAGQRRAIGGILQSPVFFSCFSCILQQEGHKFMYGPRHFFEVFLTQCKDMHFRLICNAKLSLGVNFSVDCCLSPCVSPVINWLNITLSQGHPLTVNGRIE